MEEVLNSLHATFSPIWYSVLASPMGFIVVLGLVAILFFAIGRSLTTPDRLTQEVMETGAKLQGVMGKLQRMETTINDIRTESIRNAEAIKRALFQIHSDTAARTPLDGGDDEGSGGGPSPSSSGGSSGGGGPAGGSSFSSSSSSIEDFFDDADVDSRLGFEEKNLVEEVTIDDEDEPINTAPTQSLSHRLSRWRRGFFEKVTSVFGKAEVLSPSMIDELEAELVGADLGIAFTQKTIGLLKEKISLEESVTPSAVKALLKKQIQGAISINPRASYGLVIPEKKPLVVLVVGVNGVGKTTTTAKLAADLSAKGEKVLMVAADTFRAAAVEQLSLWGTKLGIPVIFGPDSAKPQTVVFDGMKAAIEQEVDVVLIDTAGRLHNKSHLMQELEGVKNAIDRHMPGAPHETLLVVDGSSGQNAMMQARVFDEATPLTGVIVTKLDGTSKGGVVVAIADELKIPIRYIGVGEGENDLRVFEPHEFVEALFDEQGLTIEGPTEHAKTRRRRRDDSVEEVGVH